MKRRFFVKSIFATGLTAAAAGCQKRDEKQTSMIPRRHYRDDVELSIAGFGGVVVVGMEQFAANNLVAEAFERGVNYYDVAPSYGNGEAEEKLGVALKPFRKRTFLACKTLARDAAGAQKEFIQSQKRLFTDYFDLYQFHSVNKPEEISQLFSKGGAAEFVFKMREQGQIRYLGFSTHSETAALALMDQFAFDSVFFPISFVCYAQGDFGPRVVKKAKEKNIALLAMKTLALRKYRKEDARKYPNCWYFANDERELAQQAFDFTLSEGAVAVVSPGDQQLFRLEMELASNTQPFSAAARQKLFEKSVGMEPLFKS